MTKTTTTQGRGRTMTAAARAAAKRAERGHHAPGPETDEAPLAGRTVLVEAPEDGWDDPPEPTPEAFEADTSKEPRRWLPTAVLALLLVAGLVAVAVLGWQYREARTTQDARGEALTAARQAAPVVLSYDYQHLDRDFTRARTHLTGGFRDDYRKTTTAVVAPTAEKYHGVVKATVATASVVSASPDKVVVLLFVNQVTQSTQVSGSRLDLNRVRMTMSRTSEGWKVSAVDAL
jgi:Mce-associated membrane protein